MTGVIFLSTAAFSQNTYTLDKMHARISFSIKHMGISFVEGVFQDFEATLVSSKEDFTDAQIGMTAQVKSFYTGVEMRDNDLRDNWFEASKFPTLSFTSTSFTKVDGNIYKLKGNITIHGVTQQITFDVVYNGKAQSPFSKKYSAGFTITGMLKWKDFGIVEKGFPTVAEDVAVRSNVEFVIN